MKLVEQKDQKTDMVKDKKHHEYQTSIEPKKMSSSFILRRANVRLKQKITKVVGICFSRLTPTLAVDLFDGPGPGQNHVALYTDLLILSFSNSG